MNNAILTGLGGRKIFQLVVAAQFLILVSAFGAATETLPLLSRKDPAGSGELPAYVKCESCGGCHVNAYREHMGSMHAQSFANPVFLAQYREDVLPRTIRNVRGFRLARSCTSCHAPVAHERTRARVVVPDPGTALASGVTCDFCHTIAGFNGSESGNGNYRTEPGEMKLGPLQTQTGWHHQYSALQTKSEFCGICHSVRNQHGLDVKSTYAEWKTSRHAGEGIQCQDCHMSLNGFLAEGRPVHASGKAAVMTLGEAPVRDVLYTHRFQGARTHSQIEGAIGLSFQSPNAIVPGTELTMTLLVDNSRTGHKLPSGSVELRYLWIDACAEVDGKRIELSPTADQQREAYDIVGGHAELDKDILAEGVPVGRRIYRTLLADASGKSTLGFFDAEKIIFDNRLDASEIRAEAFTFRVPDSASREMTVSARLYYVAYPDSFARRLKLPKAEPVCIASTAIQLEVTSPSGDSNSESPAAPLALSR